MNADRVPENRPQLRSRRTFLRDAGCAALGLTAVGAAGIGVGALIGWEGNKLLKPEGDCPSGEHPLVKFFESLGITYDGKDFFYNGRRFGIDEISFEQSNEDNCPERIIIELKSEEACFTETPKATNTKLSTSTPTPGVSETSNPKDTPQASPSQFSTQTPSGGPSATSPIQPSNTQPFATTEAPIVTEAPTQPVQPSITPGGSGETPVVPTPGNTAAPVIETTPILPAPAPSSTPSF